MPNISKISDPRFWLRWKWAGALGGLPFSSSATAGEAVVSIAGSMYVKTKAALENLLNSLREKGYTIKDLRDPGEHFDKNVSVQTMEKQGWSLWYASLDVRRGECKSCGGYISTLGIQCHGHQCELCGAATYYSIVDGSTVRFSFIQKDEDSYSLADVTMVAKRWDTEVGYLYLYPNVAHGLWTNDEAAQKYFNANRDKWEAVEEEGVALIKVRYLDSFYVEKEAAISMRDIHGSVYNHHIVRVWEGKEYPEYGNFPIAESMSIYETWHWAPLKPSLTLHQKVLLAVGDGDDKGWHYQDGRAWFTRQKFAEMGKFVRHFTTLDADQWDVQSQRFRLDGPGGIDDVAHFCHPRARGENRPNVGNLLFGMGKILSGESLTYGEQAAMADAAKDPEQAGLFARAFAR